LQMQNLCFNEFPDQCAGCPEYKETLPDQTAQLILMTGMGMIYPQNRVLVIKECKRYHKRKVESSG